MVWKWFPEILFLNLNLTVLHIWPSVSLTSSNFIFYPSIGCLDKELFNTHLVKLYWHAWVIQCNFPYTNMLMTFKGMILRPEVSGSESLTGGYKVPRISWCTQYFFPLALVINYSTGLFQCLHTLLQYFAMGLICYKLVLLLLFCIVNNPFSLKFWFLFISISKLVFESG